MARKQGEDSLYFRGKEAIKFQFSTEEHSSEGGVVLISKLETPKSKIPGL